MCWTQVRSVPEFLGTNCPLNLQPFLLSRRRSPNCWTRNCPACSKIEGGFKSQSIGVYSTRNHQSTDLGCLRQSVLQRTNPRYIPTASFIVGVHMPPSSLREGGPPLDPPIRYHFFVSFFCKTDNPTQAKRPLSPPPRLLTPTLQKAHF